MIKYECKSIISCDVCGKENIRNENEAVMTPIDEEYMPEKINWVEIKVSKYLGVKNGGFNNHTIDICPDCYKSVLNYLKENCDNASTWPKDL